MRLRSLIAGVVAAVAAAHCRSASAPVSLARAFDYTVRWPSGDTLRLRGDGASWMWAPPPPDTTLATHWWFDIAIGPPAQTNDSLFPRPVLFVQGIGTRFRDCPPTGSFGIDTSVAWPSVVAVSLWLGPQEPVAAVSGQVSWRKAADSVVVGDLDVTFALPAPGFRLTGSFTAAGRCG